MKNKDKVTAALKVAIKNKVGKGIIEGSSLSQKHREVLLKAGWLTEILRGWYILSQPQAESFNEARDFPNIYPRLLYFHNEEGHLIDITKDTFGEEFSKIVAKYNLKMPQIQLCNPRRTVVKALYRLRNDLFQ